LLDFNRAGVPLVEVVSKPDIRTAAQARAYAQELRNVVLELDVSDAKLEEGSMRFDANVSVRHVGAPEFGTKVEVKNMNSFRSLERAVDHEIVRQIDELTNGGSVIQETRHWDEEAGVTHGMRTKEGSSDYRYFTEPDLVPMVIDSAWRKSIESTLPELPAQRRERYTAAGVDPHKAEVLASADHDIRSLFDAAAEAGADPQAAANWATGEVTAWLRREDVELQATPLDGGHLAELVGMIGDSEISASAAKDVLDGVLRGEGGPRAVAEARDLLQVSDAEAIENAIDEVLAANPDAVARYSGGETKVVGFLVGQVMRSMGGKADPKIVNSVLRSKLG
jgi:aspartyl-tRNA(Asn)/glutamyl-tRNA(Gln) amidotransferase subunit B